MRHQHLDVPQRNLGLEKNRTIPRQPLATYSLNDAATLVHESSCFNINNENFHIIQSSIIFIKRVVYQYRPMFLSGTRPQERR